jgi:DNA-binding transcriptional ArsR family regulator
MVDITDITLAAALLGDPARANMLCALKDEGALSATELAHIAGVAPNTASGHLAKLSEAGLISVHRTGRWRYYSLAGHQVATILENIEALAGQIVSAKLETARGGQAMRFARSCYDHLAGKLAVKLTDAFVRLGYLEKRDGRLLINEAGMAACTEMGVDLNAANATRRPFLRQCPDWSEGSVHIGGTLGARLYRHFRREGWLKSSKGVRAVRLTSNGKMAFREHFGIDVTAWPADTRGQ